MVVFIMSYRLKLYVKHWAVHNPTVLFTNNINDAMEFKDALSVTTFVRQLKLVEHGTEKNKTVLNEVPLIASGYEWICPNCEETNKVVEVPSSEMVKCSRCDKRYRMEDYRHALQT